MTMKEKLDLHEQIEHENKAKENEWKEGKIAMKKAVVLRTNGTIEIVDYPEDDVLTWCYKTIGCDIVECVRPINLPDGVVMVVDEEGLLVDRPVLNPLPSYLYGFMEHRNPICGDVIVMKEELSDDGYAFAGMDEEEANKWYVKFASILPIICTLVANSLESQKP